MNNQFYIIRKDLRDEFESYIKSGKKRKNKVSMTSVPLNTRTINEENIRLTCEEIYDSYIIFSRGSSGKRNRDADVNNCINNLVSEINKYFTGNESYDQNKFDSFHHERCEKFMQDFNSISTEGFVKINYGSAQKMVNMLFKYLACFSDYEQNADKFVFCHIPIDNYIMKALKEKFGISNIECHYYKLKKKDKVAVQTYYLREGKPISWTNFSKDDYKALVEDYRKAIELNGKTYLGLEFELWKEGIGY